MNSQLEWLTRQIDEGLELYIFIDERNVMNGFEHRIAPYVNVEGLCENIRRWNSKTLKLREFSGFGQIVVHITDPSFLLLISAAAWKRSRGSRFAE